MSDGSDTDTDTAERAEKTGAQFPQKRTLVRKSASLVDQKFLVVQLYLANLRSRVAGELSTDIERFRCCFRNALTIRPA